MPNRVTESAIARLLELTVRTAFTRPEEEDRRLVDWSALRYFAQASEAGRTRSGLANYLGAAKARAANIVGRLVEEGLVVASNETQIDLTEAGLTSLATDPLLRLAAAISTLEPDKQALVADALETIQETLFTATRRPH